MRKPKKTSILLLIPVIGTLSMTLVAGCAKDKEFVMTAHVDREWLRSGQNWEAPVQGVFLSDRAFKYYAKGCE